MSDTGERPSRFTVTRISRSSGARTVALAAHRHATAMSLPSGESTADYGKDAHHVTHSGIAFPECAPAWAADAYGAPAFQAALKEILASEASNTAAQAERPATGAEGGGRVAGRRKGSAGTRALSAWDADRRAWACLSERLWNDIEHVETLLNRQPNRAELARDVVASLPRTLSLETQVDLVQQFVQEAFTRHGTVVDCVLRDNGRGMPLAFMMFPTRLLADGGWGGRTWRMHPYRLFMTLRATWLRHVNRALERDGVPERLEETPDGRRLCLTRTGRRTAPTGKPATTNGDRP